MRGNHAGALEQVLARELDERVGAPANARPDGRPVGGLGGRRVQREAHDAEAAARVEPGYVLEKERDGVLPVVRRHVPEGEHPRRVAAAGLLSWIDR